MSTPSTTVPQSFIQEIYDPWAAENSSSKLFEEAKITINTNGQDTMPYVEALIPLIKGAVRQVEFFKLCDYDMRSMVVREGMALFDERRKPLVYIPGVTIGYRIEGPTRSRDILAMLDVPASVHDLLSEAVRNIPRQPFNDDRSYGARLKFA